MLWFFLNIIFSLLQTNIALQLGAKHSAYQAVKMV